MIRLPRPRAVLFDWDSTLVDNWGAIARALEGTFLAMGHAPWNEDQVRARAKKSLRDTFPTLFGSRSDEATRMFYSGFEAVHLETLKALEGATEILERLAALGIPTAVVSNKSGSYLRREAAHLGWDRYFHRIVGATDAPRDKPAPDPVYMALEGTGIAAGPDVWFVGDSAVDLACAHAAGCTAVLVHPEDPHPEDVTVHPPAVHLPGCLALLRQLHD
ncbi:MAG TPA: HAD family hydrolase [Thalassobaculum sp.]